MRVRLLLMGQVERQAHREPMDKITGNTIIPPRLLAVELVVVAVVVAQVWVAACIVIVEIR